MSMDRHDRIKLQMMVGKIKAMRDAGYTAKQIAESLGIPESTARKWVRECMTYKEAKEILNELEELDEEG